jgi:putative ABC transport system permease protein
MIRIFNETIILTIQQFWSNKMRTFLSLFGISIGIFSIISILTAVDALRNNINDSINSLGDNVLFVNKWAWTFDGPTDYPWWKYFQRPQIKYNIYKCVENKTKLGESVAFELNPRSTPIISYQNRKTQKAFISAVTANYGKVFQLDILYGRFLSTMETNNGINVCVIGKDVAEKLFKNIENPVGYEIKIDGKNLKVIGVINKKGESLLGFNYDKSVILPYYFYDKNFNIDENNVDISIEVRAKEGVELSELKQELISLMRAARKLRPTQNDDFSINQLSVIAKGFDGVFDVLGIIKWIIGGFSLLVGGFGIANIMFVSVSERKAIIGVKKALGAKNKDILLEFLFEAILLCLIGGAIGLFLVWLITGYASEASGMLFTLTSENILIAFIVSFVLGIASGIIPAYSAAKMDPVEAIRSK